MATTTTCENCGKETHFVYLSMYYEDICIICKIKEIAKRLNMPEIKKTQHLDDKLFEI